MLLLLVVHVVSYHVVSAVPHPSESWSSCLVGPVPPCTGVGGEGRGGVPVHCSWDKENVLKLDAID